MTVKICLLAATLTLSGWCAFAQAEINPAYEPIDPAGRWAFSLGIDQLAFDKQKAAEEYVGNSTTALDINGEYFFRSQWSWSIGGEMFAYSDKGSFRQWTQSNSGDIQETKSDASGMTLYTDLGYKKIYQKGYVSARGGLATLLASERSISNCSNCASSDIKLDAGAYVSLGGGLRINQSFLLGLHYKQFLTGDIKSGIGLDFTFGSF